MKNKLYLNPSMMCADFANLEKEVKALDESGIDIFHLDVMDGDYVPNFGIGPFAIEAIRRNTNKPIDVHLMISNPSRHIDFYHDLGVNIIYFHPETDLHPTRTLAKIKSLGMKSGLVVNPGTSFDSVKELLPLTDIVLMMTVNPGFAGQQFLDFTRKKIKTFVNHKLEFGYEVHVDGAISRKIIKEMHALGVEGFVLGTSSLFGKEESYEDIIKAIRKENP